MPIESAEDLAIFFDEDEFASPALFRSAGASLPVSVMQNEGTRDVAFGSGTIRMDALLLMFRRREVGQPAIDDLIDWRGRTVRITAEPTLDWSGEIWTVEVEPA